MIVNENDNLTTAAMSPTPLCTKAIQALPRRLFVAGVICCALVLSGCGGGSAGNESPVVPPPPPPPLLTPTVTSASPQVVRVGESIALTGSHLLSVSRFYKGDIELERISVTDTTAQVRALQAGTGPLRLQRRSDGAMFTAAQSLTAFMPMTVSGMSATQAYEGQSVSLNGTALAAATAVHLSGTVAAIQSQTDTQIVFVVPTGAVSGAVSLASAHETIQAGNLTVLPSVSTTAVTVYALSGSAATDLGLEIRGRNLNLVQSLYVGTTQVPKTSQSAVLITTTVPSGIEGGIRLTYAEQRYRAAGEVRRSGAAVLTMSDIAVAQVYKRTAADTSMRLTPQKPALLRVALTTTAHNVPSPQVQLTATKGRVALGSLPMSGPAVLPLTVTETDTVNTFTAAIPAAWVQSGVAFTVQTTGGHRVDSSPAVGTATRLDLVIVPITIGAVGPKLPDLEYLRDELVRVFPYARGNITLAFGAPMTGTLASQWANTQEVLDALIRLEQRRRIEAPGKYYYGLWSAERNGTAGVAGLGFVNSAGLHVWSLSSVGIDGWVGWVGGPDTPNPFDRRLKSGAYILLHELGHNHGLWHAPCGGAPGPDPEYPYPDGGLGPRILHNSTFEEGDAGTLGSAFNRGAMAKDLMGYCGGLHLSDFHFNKTQVFAEAVAVRFPSAVQALRVAAPGVRLVNISGSITPTRTTIHPIRVVSTGQVTPSPASSDWALRIRTESGAVNEVPFRCRFTPLVATSDSCSRCPTWDPWSPSKSFTREPS
jgi:hypothetical protein